MYHPSLSNGGRQAQLLIVLTFSQLIIILQQLGILLPVAVSHYHLVFWDVCTESIVGVDRSKEEHFFA